MTVDAADGADVRLAGRGGAQLSVRLAGGQRGGAHLGAREYRAEDATVELSGGARAGAQGERARERDGERRRNRARERGRRVRRDGHGRRDGELRARHLSPVARPPGARAPAGIARCLFSERGAAV